MDQYKTLKYHVNCLFVSTDLLSTVGLNRNSKEEHALMLEEKLKDVAVGGIDKVQHLYGHGVCKWPGCETMCDDLQTFLK